ncbi:serine carboxypeptidase-like 16 [Artemisia annua]|uniref:Serine carboxypeptidase-like 16 n=1 Tax=Artemisia annua TaxID=35608 RepID=A0A2U1LV78_ARTAN|nr:serine carboxypeptidase-like 16 [Artemisia annua]
MKKVIWYVLHNSPEIDAYMNEFQSERPESDMQQEFPRWFESKKISLFISKNIVYFYVNDQVGGYEMRYTQNNFSLTFATVKGAGHSVAQYKPEEALVLTEKWLALKTYSVDSM